MNPENSIIDVTIRDSQFRIRSSFLDTLKIIKEKHEESPWESIQALLVGLFTEVSEVRSDEVAATVHAFFPASKYVNSAPKRTSTDVRKFNKGQLSGQEGAPEVVVSHLDAPKGGAKKSADDALEVLQDLCS